MAVFYNNNIPYQPIVPRPYPSGTSSFQFPTRWTLRQSTSTLFKIKDPSKNVMYRAEERAVISYGLYYRLYDAESGELLGKIKGRMFRLGMPKYKIFLDGTEYATMRQRMTFLRTKLTIKSSDNDASQISIYADLMDKYYTFKRGEDTIATLSKGWLIHRNKYTVDIVAGENVLLILSCCILIHKLTFNLI